MTVEAFLTRELQVRFIDARNLATEAKLKLGITGYPSPEQQQPIIDEALFLFNEKPDEIKAAMRQLSESLNAVTAADRLTRNCNSGVDLSKSGRIPKSGSNKSVDVLGTASDHVRKSTSITNMMKSISMTIRRRSGENLTKSSSGANSLASCEETKPSTGNATWGDKPRKPRTGGKRPNKMDLLMGNDPSESSRETSPKRLIPNTVIDMSGMNGGIKVL